MLWPKGKLSVETGQTHTSRLPTLSSPHYGHGALIAASILPTAHPLTLIHPSDPWPLPGHPEAMKMSRRQGYFHTSA